MELVGAREILAKYLSPSRPVSSPEMLQGRRQELSDIRDALEMGSGAPLIFGNRGVGKTSLARTAAQEHTASDREPLYVACSPNGPLLRLLRGAAAGLSDLAIKLGRVPKKTFEVEAHVGLTPSLKFVAKSAKTEAP